MDDRLWLHYAAQQCGDAALAEPSVVGVRDCAYRASSIVRRQATSRRDAFLDLAADAQACCRCASMTGRTAVLSELNGSLNPLVLFVAEAPGRRGADRTRVPMTCDASGRAFRYLLASVGLADDDVFVTNAVLCNPRTADDANRTPAAVERANCREFLARTIDLLDPVLVVSVGAAALKALGAIEPHRLALGRDVGVCTAWCGRALIPLYHPSPRVLHTRRSLEQQVEDWKSIGLALGGIPGRDSRYIPASASAGGVEADAAEGEGSELTPSSSGGSSERSCRPK